MLGRASQAPRCPHRAGQAALVSLIVAALPAAALAGSATHTYDFRKPATLGSSVRGPATITVTDVNPLRYLDAYLSETRTVQESTSPGSLFGLGQASSAGQTLANLFGRSGGNKAQLLTQELVIAPSPAVEPPQCGMLVSASTDFNAALSIEQNLQVDKSVVEAASADFQPLFGPNGPSDPVSQAMEVARGKAPVAKGASSNGHIVSYYIDANGGVVATDAVNNYDKDVQDALTALNGIPRSAYNTQCALSAGGGAAQEVRVGDAVDKLTPELNDRSNGGSRYDDVHAALDDLRDWATRLYAAANHKEAYEVSRVVDCHDAHGFTSSTVAVTLDATDATKAEKGSNGPGHDAGNKGSSHGKGGGTHGGDHHSAGKNNGNDSSSQEPNSVSVDVVTVECQAPLTATNGGTLSSLPQQGFTVARVSSSAAAGTMRGKHGQGSQTGTIQLSTNKSSQTSYNPAAISYRLPILQNDAGTDISLTAALSNTASGMAGLTLSFERSIFLTAAVIRSDYSSLGGGYTLGEQVPLNTKLPIVKMPTTRFALMLSFPTPANGLFHQSKRRDQSSGSDSSNGNGKSNSDKGNDGH